MFYEIMWGASDHGSNMSVTCEHAVGCEPGLNLHAACEHGDDSAHSRWMMIMNLLVRVPGENHMKALQSEAGGAEDERRLVVHQGDYEPRDPGE